ncbi:hypothetical protein KM043_002608 [Ampulex compressa]|nr:hypothetical protein KM043_002608 [Ampulex compressa]
MASLAHGDGQDLSAFEHGSGGQAYPSSGMATAPQGGCLSKADKNVATRAFIRSFTRPLSSPPNFQVESHPYRWPEPAVWSFDLSSFMVDSPEPRIPQEIRIARDGSSGYEWDFVPSFLDSLPGPKAASLSRYADGQDKTRYIGRKGWKGGKVDGVGRKREGRTRGHGDEK